jgi:hypothetical protein
MWIRTPHGPIEVTKIRMYVNSLPFTLYPLPCYPFPFSLSPRKILSKRWSHFSRQPYRHESPPQGRHDGKRFGR